MNLQKTFDTIVAHLRKQNAKSFNSSGKCAYRGANGMKCAVGVLIHDKNYQPRFDFNDGMPAMHPDIMHALNASGNIDAEVFAPTQCMSMLLRMQNVHDHTPIPKWEEAFERVAKEFGLKLTEV